MTASFRAASRGRSAILVRPDAAGGPRRTSGDSSAPFAPLDMYEVSQKTSTASRSTDHVAYTCRGFAETDGRAPRPAPGVRPHPEPRRHLDADPEPDHHTRAFDSSGFVCRELKEGSDVYGSR